MDCLRREITTVASDDKSGAFGSGGDGIEGGLDEVLGVVLLLEDLDTLAKTACAWTLAVEGLCGDGLNGGHEEEEEVVVVVVCEGVVGEEDVREQEKKEERKRRESDAPLFVHSPMKKKRKKRKKVVREEIDRYFRAWKWCKCARN